MTRRTIGILVLLVVVGFYALGTGFPFFFRLLYAITLVLLICLVWAWLNLRRLEVQLTRSEHRGQVGGYLGGQIRIISRTGLPKSWLEVGEVTDLPDYSSGRGLALLPKQSRTWRIQTYLARRGVYRTGQVEVTSRDPFGLFELRQRFLQPQQYTVLPATQPLPDLDYRFAILPSDSRITRRSDHITTDASTVREYAYGDTLTRIHWPSTARMNTLMVKEFDMGISAEAWVLLDLQQGVHLGSPPDNTEELAVTIAASLISRLLEMSMPVGLAADGDQTYLLRPNRSPEQQGRLMEALASVRAQGRYPLERFIYHLRPHLNRYNALTIVTPSARGEWISAVDTLRRGGINAAVVLIDPQSFGGSAAVQGSLDSLLMNDIPTYLVKRGQPLNEALRFPLGLMGDLKGSVVASTTRQAVP